MSKTQKSKIQLKRLIQQQSLPSKVLSNQSHKSKFTSLELLNNQHTQKHTNFIDCTFNLDINSKYTQNLELKIQSKVNHTEIDDLLLESKVLQEEKNYQNQNYFEAELVKSSLLEKQHSTEPPVKPLKVHSSIDGMQGSKKQVKQASLPISDLILSDNNYMKLSSRLNQHQKFSSKEENDRLTQIYLENLKLQKQQIIQLSQLIDTEMKFIESTFLEESLKSQIRLLEIQNQKIKRSSIFSPVSCSSDYFSQKNTKSRSKTPQNYRINSPKITNTPKTLLNRKNVLQNKIKNQNQKIKQQREKSVKVIQKLSQAKSDYDQITDKLTNFTTRLHNLNEKSYKFNKPVSPVSERHKSPLNKDNKNNKFEQFLKNQVKKYYKTLKDHRLIIHREMQTFREYEMEKIEQLKEEIALIKNEIKFIDVKSMDKMIIGSQKQAYKAKKQKQLSKKSVSPSTKAFQSNFSENTVRTVSPILSLSPRSPQLYSKSPQNFRKSPQLYKRYTEIQDNSKNKYENSPYYSNRQFQIDSSGSMTPRSLRQKDMNKMSCVEEVKEKVSKQLRLRQALKRNQQRLEENLNLEQIKSIEKQKGKRTDKGKENLKITVKKEQQKNANKDVKNKKLLMLKGDKVRTQFVPSVSKTGVELLR